MTDMQSPTNEGANDHAAGYADTLSSTVKAAREAHFEDIEKRLADFDKRLRTHPRVEVTPEQLTQIEKAINERLRDRYQPLIWLAVIVILALVVLLLILRTAPYLMIESQAAALAEAFRAGQATLDTDGAAALIEELNVLQASMENLRQQAVDFLGLFEAIGLVLTVGGVLLGIIGVSRLNSAESELKKATDSVRVLESELQQEIETTRNAKADIKSDLRRDYRLAQQALALIPFAQKQYHTRDYEGALDTYMRAKQMVEQAARIEGDDDEKAQRSAVLNYHIGYIYIQQKRYQDAKDVLEQAIETDGALHQARAALGLAYRKIGEQQSDPGKRDELYIKAERELQIALANVPRLVDDDGEPWWGSLGGLYRRWAELSAQDKALHRYYLNRAINAYEIARSVAPSSSYPYMPLGILYLQRGQIDDPQQSYVNALNSFSEAYSLALKRTVAEPEYPWPYSDVLLIESLFEAVGRPFNSVNWPTIRDEAKSWRYVSDVLAASADDPLKTMLDGMVVIFEALVKLGKSDVADRFRQALERRDVPFEHEHRDRMDAATAAPTMGGTAE